MFKKIALTFFLIASVLVVPFSFAFAGTVNLPNPFSGTLDPGTDDSGIFIDEEIQDLIVRYVVIVFRLLAIGAIIPIVVGGFQLIISQGGEYAQKGKKTLYWGVVGLIIAFLGILIFDYLLAIFTPSS